MSAENGFDATERAAPGFPLEAFDRAPVGLALFDRKGQLLQINRRLASLLGRSAAEIATLRIHDVTHPDDIDADREHAARLLAGELDEHTFDKRYLRPDGSVVSARVTCAALRDATGRVSQFVTAVHPEEPQRRDEALFAMLGHELRNPLAALGNALHLLQRPDFPVARDAATLEMAQRQVRQMQGLIDGLLETSRVAHDRIEIRRERMLVGAAVHHAVEAIGAELAVRAHALTVELPPEPIWILADPIRVGQMLGNLLRNACKYTPRGGRLLVGVRTIADAVEIRVSDNGVGIDPCRLTHIFELFAQIDTTRDRAEGGLGIGLALVRRLAERHGGSVRAESDGPGRGATFTLSLPLPSPVRAPQAERFASLLGDSRLRALYDAWLAARDGTELPAVSTVDVFTQAGVEHTFVVAVTADDPNCFRYLRVGGALTDRLGRPLEGTAVMATAPDAAAADDAPPDEPSPDAPTADATPAIGHDALADLASAYTRCRRDRVPAFDYARWRGLDGSGRVERLLLPCADDGIRVTHLLGMVLFTDSAAG